MRSRENFATTEAAAMEGQIPSPLTTAICSLFKCLAGRPSTRITPPAGGIASKALRIATWLATRMLKSAISSTEASPKAQTPTPPSVKRRKTSSLFLGVSFLQSSSPGILMPLWWNRKAAATTGPASAPRPASSSPVTATPPAFARSDRQSGGMTQLLLAVSASLTDMSARPRR